MMIHGFGFLSLSASLVLPWALTGLVQGKAITESLFKDVRRSSTDQKMQLPNRKLISQVSTATTYYVSATGNDRNGGRTTSSAFKTIQRAADLTKPGDTVMIMNGEYKNEPDRGTVLGIKRSGTAKAWIKFQAYPGHSPKIKHNTWSGISLADGVSYIEINGLEVIGNTASVTRAYALSQQYKLSNPLTNGNCILIDGRKRTVHHINILNNKVHNCPGGGIAVVAADYVKADNNTVFNTSWYSPYGNSGISFFLNADYDNNRGYKHFITNNRVYNNRQYIRTLSSKRISDGGGIIVDSSQGGKNGGYKGRTLIANNISYNNGGQGIIAHESNHVDIVNNTVYGNGQSPELSKVQLAAGYSNDVKIYNNIIHGFPGQQVNKNMRNKNVIYDYNLYPKGAVSVVGGIHDVVGDPQFINPSAGDFRLRSKSAAINKGYYWKDVKTDHAGKPRPANKFTIGAYQ
ncbi:right-handed parallel beta-helix repeat-containing protein [Nostoc commune]|uniref:right-handed parallel beta-helix repeat-containing protein n=1 Tax=Nostoc commune TaxID=1178 RepID=UPI0020734FC5|nr:right-handed parallel beta-helix repeat-containing protein [Nostoc commune]